MMGALPTGCGPRRADVDLWLAPIGPLRDDQVRLCRSILSADERARVDRFRIPARAEQALVGRALLRRALTYRLGAAPESWVFETGAHDRPCLAAGQALPTLDFNLAHTAGHVLCAVSQGAAVGVDVERRSRAGDLQKVAPRFLAEAEALALAGLEPAARDARLLRLWTLKEAYSKALGLGLTMDYRTTTFVISGRGETATATCAGLAGWYFQVAEAPEHTLALAVQAEDAAVGVTRRDGLGLLFGALAQ